MLPQGQAVQAQIIQAQNDTVPRAVHEEAVRRLEEQLRLRQQCIENIALVASSGLPRILNL